MQFTIIALGVALAVLVMSLWRARTRGANREHLEARCRRDIQVLRRTSQSRNGAHRSDDVWSPGADADPAQSRAKKAVAWGGHRLGGRRLWRLWWLRLRRLGKTCVGNATTSVARSPRSRDSTFPLRSSRRAHGSPASSSRRVCGMAPLLRGGAAR
jgi:hypothetical protein